MLCCFRSAPRRRPWASIFDEVLSRRSIYRSSCVRMSSAQDEPQGPTVRVATLPRRLNVPVVLVQFVKFGIVGVSNTLLTFAVYTLLLKVFGVWYLAASAIGFVGGATNGFLLNRRWTFRGACRRRADPGALGDRAERRARDQPRPALRVRARRRASTSCSAQALATVVVTVHDVPRQPRLDLQARAVARADRSGGLAEHGEQREPGGNPPAAPDHRGLERRAEARAAS